MIYCFDPVANRNNPNEYKYNAHFFRIEGSDVTYVLTEMMDTLEMASIMKNLKVTNERVMWLYSSFAEKLLKYPSFTLTDYVNSLKKDKPVNYIKNGNIAKLTFMNDSIVEAHLYDAEQEIMYRADKISHGHLEKKEYYLDELIFTELYNQRGKSSDLYSRRFHNMHDRSSYDEINPLGSPKYVFGNTIIESKGDLLEIFLKMLRLTRDDTIMIDSSHKYINLISSNMGEASLRMTQSNSAFDIFNF